MGLPSTALYTVFDKRATMNGFWMTRSWCLGANVTLFGISPFQPMSMFSFSKTVS